MKSAQIRSFSFLRQIPLSIESRLSKHSSNKKTFNKSIQIYQEALKKSEYDYQLTYQKIYKQQKRRNQTTQKKNNLVQSTILQEYFNKSRKPIPKTK